MRRTLGFDAQDGLVVGLRGSAKELIKHHEGSGRSEGQVRPERAKWPLIGELQNSKNSLCLSSSCFPFRDGYAFFSRILHKHDYDLDK